MLLFLGLVLSASRSLLINQIAIEYRRNAVARSASNGYDVSEMKSYKEPAFSIADGSVVLGSLSPSRVYNFHTFLETPETLDTCSSIRKRGNSLYIPNLETPVSSTSLSSLYIRALFKKYHDVSDGVSVTVSGRDYLTEEQRNTLARVFSTIGHRVKVIPETLAACTRLASMTEEERSYAFLNLRGTQGMLVAYKVKRDGKKITVSKTHESKVEALADEAVERLAASYVISQLKGEGMEDTAFLPYESAEGKEHYVDIQAVVDQFIQAVGTGQKVLKILQVDIRKKTDDSLAGGLIERSIKMGEFRKKHDLGIPELPELEDGTTTILLSGIDRPGPFIRETRELILDGLVEAHSSNIVFEDPRILERMGDMSYEMMAIDKELKLRRTGKDFVRDFSELRKTLIHVLDSEVEPLVKLMDEDLSKVENLFKLEKAYEDLQLLSNRRIANAVLKDGYLRGLDDRLADAKAVLKEEGIEEALRSGLESYSLTTEEWLEKNRGREDVLGEIQRRTFMLEAHVNLIKEKLKKISSAKATEEKKSEGEAPPQGNSTSEEKKSEDELPPQGNSTTEEKKSEGEVPPQDRPGYQTDEKSEIPDELL